METREFEENGLKKREYKIGIKDREINIFTYIRTEKGRELEVIEHDSVMRLGEALGIEFDADATSIDVYGENGMLSVVAKAVAVIKKGNKKFRVVEYHEAHSPNIFGDTVDKRYPVRMAYKRAQDKAILCLARSHLEGLGLPEHLYSDIELSFSPLKEVEIPEFEETVSVSSSVPASSNTPQKQADTGISTESPEADDEASSPICWKCGKNISDGEMGFGHDLLRSADGLDESEINKDWCYVCATTLYQEKTGLVGAEIPQVTSTGLKKEIV